MRLGSGENEAFIFERGGKTPIGRITQADLLKWDRRRDEVSEARVTVQGPDTKCRSLLANTRSVRHELVVARNGKRVWEGPIIRMSYTGLGVEISAADVLWFAGRRIKESLLNFSSVSTDALDVQLALLAEMFNDPTDWANVMDYLTVIRGADSDARTSKKIEAYTQTVLDILEGFSTSGGTDYTVVGRRIILFDVHTRIGTTNTLTDSHFLSPLTVTEHGSDLATRTFSRGATGNVTRQVAPTEWVDYYGKIDKVRAPDDEQDVALAKFSTGPALDTGFPAPLRIKVPDNSGIHPDAPITMEQLVPGSWVPIRSSQTARDVEQWMKIQTVSVEDAGEGETVRVTFVDAPATSQDPDA